MALILLLWVWPTHTGSKFPPLREESAPLANCCSLSTQSPTQTTTTAAEFLRDCMLIFANAMMYNDDDHDVYQYAAEVCIRGLPRVSAQGISPFKPAFVIARSWVLREQGSRSVNPLPWVLTSGQRELRLLSISSVRLMNTRSFSRADEGRCAGARDAVHQRPGIRGRGRGQQPCPSRPAAGAQPAPHAPSGREAEAEHTDTHGLGACMCICQGVLELYLQQSVLWRRCMPLPYRLYSGEFDALPGLVFFACHGEVLASLRCESGLDAACLR